MKTKHTSLLRGLLVAVSLGLASPQAWAGSIVGRINDINTGSSVTGATVTDVATGQFVNADREGQFRMDNLAAGTVELRISSVGYDSKTVTADVPATGRVSLQVLLGDKAVMLDALKVEGYREGWAKALQQKRNATNLKDILSADAAGNLPDNNVGEALSRLPGVSLEVDYGEGAFVSIRGTSPNLNTVTMNGATITASPNLGRDGRSSPMDLLNTSLISQVEVIKTLTPDMDGTSLGGTINILTPSGFDHQGRFIAGGVQYGENLGIKEPIASAEFAYTNIFEAGAGKLGVALTMNYDNRHTARDKVFLAWGGNVSQPLLGEVRLDSYRDEREKYGASFNLDYRTDDGTRIYAQTFYNNFTEDFANQEQLNATQGTRTLLSPTKSSNTAVRTDLRMISSHRESETMNLVFGASKVMGDYKVDGEVTLSSAVDRQPAYRNFSFRTGAVTVPGGYIIDYSSRYPTTANISDLVAGFNPPVRQVRGDTIDNQDKTKTASVNLQRNFSEWFGGRSGFIKVGTKYSHRDRDNVRNVGVYRAPGYLLSDFDPAITTLRPTSVLDGRYNLPNTINPVTSKASFDSLLSQGKLVFDENGSLSNQGEDTFNVQEKIWAGYVMAGVDVTSRLNVLGGFRYEHTNAPLEGPLFSIDTVSGQPQLANRNVTFNYGEFLPNLQIRYLVSKATHVRAAITKTFGRPSYSDQVPSGAFDKDGGSLTTGNPQLEPFESFNYDLSVDHYFESGGYASIAAFYKQIDNPIYAKSSLQTDVTFGGIFFPTFTTSSKENGDSASVKGLELSGKLPFSAFLSGFADGFGVDVNASFMESSVTVFSRPDEDLRLFASPERIYNVGLFYEKYGVSARLAYNYKSDSLQSIGAGPYQDIYASEHFTWDAQLSYRITENFKVFLNWQNITDETVDSYTASSEDRIFESYWFGSNIRAGIKFSF